MSTVISARNLRVEKNADGIEMAYVTIDVQSWDGSFHFEVGVRNPVLAADVLDELRARLLLLFQAAYQELSEVRYSSVKFNRAATLEQHRFLTSFGGFFGWLRLLP
jgi:hypothetical protein